MTPQQEFLRRVELKLQEIHLYLLDNNMGIAKDRVISLVRMVRDEREATPKQS